MRQAHYKIPKSYMIAADSGKNRKKSKPHSKFKPREHLIQVTDDGEFIRSTNVIESEEY